ncbi:MAG: hypothetical protein GX146_08230 [Myxococcales bacterium]|nr:hypothetical protein [Myxococcales bacterium]
MPHRFPQWMFCVAWMALLATACSDDNTRDNNDAWNNPPQSTDTGNNPPPSTDTGNNPPQSTDSWNHPPQSTDSWNNPPPSTDSWNNPPPSTDTGNNPPPDTDTGPDKNRGLIFGCAPEYRPEPTLEQLQRLTHIIPFSLQVNENGTLNQGTVPPWLTSAFVTKAHNAGVRVDIMAGGWGRSWGFSSAVANHRATLVANFVAYANGLNLDGINIDWEFPQPSEMNAFGQFLTELKAAMRPEQQLSIAVGGFHDPSEFPDSVFAAVDFIQLMAYDMSSHWPSHSDYNESIKLIDRWWNYAQDKGLEKTGLVLGVPFYTRPSEQLWSDFIAAAGANASQVIATDVWNGQEYNGITTMKNKTAHCYNNGYGGIMFWELGQDTAATHQYSLLNAISEETIALRGSLR